MEQLKTTRKNMRLKAYDYSQNGAYFITICVKDKHEMLSEVVGAIINRPQNPEPYVELSEYGDVVDKAINEIPYYYKNVAVDKYVIMPNHIHMILVVDSFDNDGRLIIAPTSNISTIIQQFKRHVTKQIGFSLWQQSFHDHIIRNEADYQSIWQYIDENPQKWEEDFYYK